jgi:hypothetical protein
LLAAVVGLVTFPPIIDAVVNGNPALAADPQSAEAFRQILGPVIVFVMVLNLVLVAVLIVGVLKLWRWLYWYLMITWGLGLLAIPTNINYVLLGHGPIPYPLWYRVIDIPIVAATAATFVWMLVAYRRYGTWARRKIVEPG